VPIDVFSSLRSAALATLFAASFASPIIAKSDAAAKVGDRLSGLVPSKVDKPALDPFVAGDVQFALPADWDRLGATSVAGATDGGKRIGTIVSGVCPGGSAGAACTNDATLRFVAYSGEDGHKLPKLDKLKSKLDDRLAKEYRGFAKVESKMRSGADGIRYLDYSFTWGKPGARRSQRLSAYRHTDGDGVVVLGTGLALDKHAAKIDEFLASAHVPVSGE
jgi:hypothetical protein